MRAIWSKDYTPDCAAAPPQSDLSWQQADGTPILSSLLRNDRHQIVILTSAFSDWHVGSPNGPPYLPQPILASQLMLSSLGGWLSSVGTWKDSPIYHNGCGVDISQWVHIASQGRDQYVRIVYEGRMKWTGHKASMVKVTERRFEPDPNSSGPVAYLRQYCYIIIREPEIDYTNLPPEEGPLPNEGRAMPLKKIRLTTLVTPKIVNPLDATKPSHINDSSFWVMTQNEPNVPPVDFPFHAIAEDSAGNKIDFVTSLIFVPDSDAEKNARLQVVENNFASAGSRRDVQVPGQKVCLVPPSSISHQEAGNDDNSSPITNTLNFVNESTSIHPTDINKSNFFTPRLLRADVRIPQIQEITGIDKPTSISFHPDYVNTGFDSINTTKVFSQIVDPTQLDYDQTQGLPPLKNAPLGLGFTAQQVGGLTTPNLSITSISASMGPLGGHAPSVNGLPDPQAIADNIKDIMKNKFDPTKIFNDEAKLFGSFKLSDLLPPPDDGAVDKDSPKMTVTRNGTTITIHLDWQPRIRGIPPPPARDVINLTLLSSSSKLVIQGELKKDLTTLQQQAEFSISCKLNDFSIELLKVITINFVLFSFIAQSGKKVNVSVKLNDTTPVEFDGDLNFVNSLRNLIPSGAFGSGDGDGNGDGDGGSGVSIDLIKNPLGIKACYAVTIPPASVGIFSLRNIALSACLTLPFEDGKPVFDFSFARRDNHFLLAISFLGGGGFFHIGLDTSKIQILEAALEFGAAGAIDLGVASGEVHIMAGIYFSMSGTESQLTGYVRCGGSLCVLGLISVSVEFNLRLEIFRREGIRSCNSHDNDSCCLFSKIS